ncbi:hypothetical protein TCAL_10095 [Tigriopus californicus]|uniref:OPA3-like protein n=1 Tax=Tigriopus californicus TaxID=6832 RepID=A0A553P9T6_TIGCA|nr:hypothetical protein TCAL_10095 [Tigriopus californicus]|eukprot:TCALIF_10095-PA protein Name:"Similar to CG13601 Putative OPA3-like protein CG13603 (Drosophila melanogaster)" AED:0.44 eAED:0.44 QI:0/-1/0/1/-1/1/1/0/150
MFVRQSSLPLARRIKSQARLHRSFKRFVVSPPAQLYHFYESKIKFNVMNLGHVRLRQAPPQLSEEDVLDLGSRLVSEMLIIGIGSAFAYSEVVKYRLREAEKENDIHNFIKDHLVRVKRMEDSLRHQVPMLNEIKRTLESNSVQPLTRTT